MDISNQEAAHRANRGQEEVLVLDENPTTTIRYMHHMDNDAN